MERRGARGAALGCAAGDGARRLVAAAAGVALVAGATGLAHLGGAAGLALLACAAPAGDAAREVPTPYVRAAQYRGALRSSQYVTMRDGVRLAVDVILPRGLAPGTKLPTLLYQGRYWRSVALRGPALLFYDSVERHNQLGPFKAWFVERGYAWIDVDTRGSGASFGTRLWDYSPDEIQDGADLADWIVRQPWSDGTVAGVGVSYSGGAAELLLANHHPAVKAALPLFCDFDQYQDILAPGGIPQRSWILAWAEFTRRLDRGLQPFDAWWFPLFVRGVRPVDGDAGRRMLGAALREHAANFDFATMADVVFRDDRPRGAPGSVAEDAAAGSGAQRAAAGSGAQHAAPESAASARADAWLAQRFGPGFRALGTDLASPHSYAGAADASGAPVYAYSGWFDGAYARAAARRFATLKNPANKLLLGPWDHALHDASPLGARGASRFDHRGELLRFLDEHVRGQDVGLAREAPVHYFTMGSEEWHAADHWPPPSSPLTLYLAPGGALARAAPADVQGEDVYTVDRGAGSGPASRWTALLGRPIGLPYPDRAQQDAHLLVYTSAPIPAAVEVTGHPVVTLHVASSATDGAFFAYLEDVAPDGRVGYVTEGLLRALHRRVQPGGPDVLGLPRRSFRRADAEPLVPGEVATLAFDLMPTSYVFAAGHAIRIAWAGADADHFAQVPADAAPTWRVQRSRAFPSSVTLPVVGSAEPRLQAPADQ